MTSFADELAAGLADLRDQYGGADMIYRRGGVSISLTNVVKGETKVPNVTHEGFAEQRDTLDLIVEAEQLIGQITEPRQGDRVDEIIDGFMESYEVTTPASGDRCWKWSDVGRTTIRIHTFLVKRAAT